MAEKKEAIREEYVPPEGFKKQEGGNFWKPEQEGEILQGFVESENEGVYGKQWVILTADKEKITTPSHRSLQARMQNARIGDQVLIRYVNEIPPKVRGENPAKMYEVFIKEGDE